ncbi:MAG: hypothetical protein M3332_16830 [Actinomycetota bacterium]|nr:hypothetical protein [Actinomycetota bacterium]
MSVEHGQVFREAWIAGVKKHYPGDPKPGYIISWEQTPEWERESAAAVYAQVHAFIKITNGRTSKLSRAQKGHFVSLCWIGQIFKHFPDPKSSYVADWDELPQWQQETDADIFERIEGEV